MAAGVRCPSCQHKFVPDPWPDDGHLSCPGCGKSLKVPRPKASDDPLVGKTIAGFQLLKRLGVGAHAAVYEARPLAGGDRAAVKLLTREAARDPENIERFQREAELAASLDHPNLVKVLGHGEERGIHWMAMELVSGASLEDVLDKKGRLPWKDACILVRQIGEALAYLETREVIHRDLKPANILLTAKGVAKLADFGFAKELNGPSGPQQGGLTMAGMAMGSPAYMAPEQVLDAKTATSSADLYGLGASLFHAVCGDTPFTGKNAYQVMEAVLKEEPTPPRHLVADLPEGLCALLDWVLEKSPEDRPASAAVFVAELTATMENPDDAERFKALRTAKRGRKKAIAGSTGASPLLWIGLAIIAAAVIGSVVLLLVR